MNFQNLIKFPLLQPIDLSVFQEIEYSQTILDVHATLEENNGKMYNVNLIDDLIIVYGDWKNGSDPLGYVRLDFSLKFERIFHIKNFNQKQLRGFALINDFGQKLSFFIQIEKLSTLWVNHLSKHLNQSGFHNYYRPVRTIGKGASASVYEIIRLDDGERFAAKVFAKEIIKNDQNKMRSFMNQLQILRNIKHQNLLKLEGVFQSQNSFYVIMQILGGGNLFEYLLKRKHGLTLPEIKDIIKNLLRGLGQLQERGIVHRDLKLQNIMMGEKQGFKPVIVDFGLAVYEDDEDYIFYQCGTPGYLSLEAINLRKGENISPKADIFSVGVVLHVLLTGRYLFEGKTSKQIFINNKMMNFDLNKEEYKLLDSEILELMAKMLETDEKQRFSVKECLSHSSMKETKQNDIKYLISPAATTAMNIHCHF